jgi:adenosylcobinamide-GDP ribazoletransferase
MPAAVAYFPVVGAVVGIAGGLVFIAAVNLWTVSLALVMAVAFIVWITGAFHEDALADALDGFGGGWEPARILAIMKDSRIGSYALVGVFFVLAAKIAALRAIFDAASVYGDATHANVLAVGCALVTAHVLGRWSSVVLMVRHPYVRTTAASDSKPAAGDPFAGAITRRHVIFATVFSLIMSAIATGPGAIGAWIIAIVVTLLSGRYFVRRIGGVTGDALGAANQLVELAVYLALAIHR